MEQCCPGARWPPRLIRQDPARRYPDRVIEAAGGVVWRRSDEDGLQVLLIHRPRYDDWSLPKGKLEPGEKAVAAALREVREETGLICELGPEVASTRYLDRKGRKKRARYWAMRPDGGAFEPNREVDAVRWVGIREAAKMLSYRRDVAVLKSLKAAVEGSDARRRRR